LKCLRREADSHQASHTFEKIATIHLSALHTRLSQLLKVNYSTFMTGGCTGLGPVKSVKHYRRDTQVSTVYLQYPTYGGKWAWPFKPPVPLVGRNYKPGKGLLIYASAENLSWLSKTTAPERFRTEVWACRLCRENTA
jgi:hypothetical protein